MMIDEAVKIRQTNYCTKDERDCESAIKTARGPLFFFGSAVYCTGSTGNSSGRCGGQRPGQLAQHFAHLQAHARQLPAVK